MISLYCFDPSTYQISRTGYRLNASVNRIVHLAREPASGRFAALTAQGVILFFNPVNDSDPMSFNISGSQNLTLSSPGIVSFLQISSDFKRILYASGGTLYLLAGGNFSPSPRASTTQGPLTGAEQRRLT